MHVCKKRHTAKYPTFFQNVIDFFVFLKGSNQTIFPACHKGSYPMLYRRFGKTEIKMPVISFGCMRTMYSWQDQPISHIPESSTTQLKKIIEHALKMGINHFETARGYGTSERQLGEVLQHIPRNHYILQTKVQPLADPDKFAENIKNSLKLLQVEHVDLLAIHGINTHRELWYSCRKDGCLAAARRLQAEGRIGHIGFSGHGPADVILAAIDHDEDNGFDYLNVHWYYIYNVNLPAIRMAEQKDMGIYIISPTDKGGMLYAPPEKLQELCKPFSPILFNDLYCLSQKGVTSISVGAADPANFDEHLKVLPLLSDIPDRNHIVIRQKLRQAMSLATGHERPDALWKKLPSWEKIPGNINMGMIIWLYNLVRGWDMHDYAKQRYSQLSTGSTWVAGNNAREIDTFDFSKLQTKHPEITEELVTLLKKAHTILHQ